MAEKPRMTQKRDFVEVEFIGRDAVTGEVFDTNIADELKKLNPQSKPQPLIVCIGEGLTIKGFDKALEEKEIGKKYSIRIPPEQGYGKRQPQLVRMIPKNRFLEHKMNPIAGMTVAIDNALAKIISSSGGRVLVDFNNPLAGKELEYEFKIKRKLTGIREKIDALQQAFFRQKFPFELDDEKKKIIFKDLNLITIIDMFKDKFREILGYIPEILVKPAKSAKPGKAGNQPKTEKAEKSAQG